MIAAKFDVAAVELVGVGGDRHLRPAGEDGPIRWREWKVRGRRDDPRWRVESCPVSRAAIWESFLFLVYDIQDRAARRPDEQCAQVVLGGVGVYFDGVVECDTVNAEISVPSGDRPRYLESGCRVGVFLAVARI